MRQNSVFGSVHYHYNPRFAKCNIEKLFRTDDKHDKIKEYIHNHIFCNVFNLPFNIFVELCMILYKCLQNIQICLISCPKTGFGTDSGTTFFD